MLSFVNFEINQAKHGERQKEPDADHDVHFPFSSPATATVIDHSMLT
jgi:hypothetical protein